MGYSVAHTAICAVISPAYFAPSGDFKSVTAAIRPLLVTDAVFALISGVVISLASHVGRWPQLRLRLIRQWVWPIVVVTTTLSLVGALVGAWLGYQGLGSSGGGLAAMSNAVADPSISSPPGPAMMGVGGAFGAVKGAGVLVTAGVVIEVIVQRFRLLGEAGTPSTPA